MPALRTSELVWNRACLDGGAGLKPGDMALGDLLAFHGPAMNGGVLHAAECLTGEELAAACEGFRYFGLPRVAALVQEAASASATGIDLDELEQKFNEQYMQEIPTDATLTSAFEADYAVRPENYAPVQ